MLQTAAETRKTQVIRFASFNVSMYRERAGGLLANLREPEDAQAKITAEIIQRVRPDVLLLNEFDYDAQARALTYFNRNYLRVGHNGQKPIDYPYRLAVPSNTGLLSSADLDGDGVISRPQDAYGYGFFPGQYAFAVLSRLPLSLPALRTFRRFRWQDMPANRMPCGFYSEAARRVLPLSSKNHIDLEIKLSATTIHLLAAHPTPPAFDDNQAQRNKRRNFDEIKFIADYINPGRGDYIYDDRGRRGGLARDACFVIMGDLNADPFYGASIEGAISQLLSQPSLNRSVSDGDNIPVSAGGREFAAQHGGARQCCRAAATADFDDGLRVDYVLPSRHFEVLDGGVFWPQRAHPLHRLVAAGGAGSDHRLVWLDLQPVSGYIESYSYGT